MKATELLLWLSARREGSWQQFRQAVEELHSDDSEAHGENDVEFPLHQQLRLDLERMGHVEFFAAGCEHGWRVTPPTLAARSTADGVRGVLCGARSPALRERLLRAATKLNWEIIDVHEVPEVIRVSTPSASTLADLAVLSGIGFQPDATLAILSNLPPCDPPSRGLSRAEFPQGADWSIHKFDVMDPAWRKIERRDAQQMRFGLLRFLIRFQRPRYFLRWRGETCEVPRAVGVYALLRHRRRRVLRYKREVGALTVPAACRPPSLLERALVLCSGLPPTYEGHRLTYSEVPFEIARFAAELLRQPIV